MKSSKEIAQKNMPTLERLAKGDVKTYGLAEWSPDVESERATMPIAETSERNKRPYRCNLTRFLKANILDELEVAACRKYAQLHEAWQVSTYPKAIDMAKERVDGSAQEQSHLDSAQQYLWVLGRLSPFARPWLQLVVLDGWPIHIARRTIGGAYATATPRFQKAVAELAESIDALYDLTAH